MALNGFHGITLYSWLRDGKEIRGSTPLQYCSIRGSYTCIVTCGEFKATRCFVVEGSYTLLICYEKVIIPYTLGKPEDGFIARELIGVLL